MDKKLFDELLTSVQQAGKVMRGELKPSRQFEFAETDVKKIKTLKGFCSIAQGITLGLNGKRQ